MQRFVVICIGLYSLGLLMILANSESVEETQQTPKNINGKDLTSTSRSLEITSTPESTTVQNQRIDRKRNEKTGKSKKFRVGGEWKLDFKKGIAGIADVDYPAYSAIPKTAFSCQGLPPGYYSDEETRCQVFHICYSSTATSKQSFLCPNGTIFSQELITCEWWTKVNCEESKKYYYMRKNYYDYDLQVSQSVTREIIALPSTTVLPTSANDIYLFDNSNDNNGTDNSDDKFTENNATNHKKDDIQLILDNLFADFHDKKGTKPIKYTEDYILQKMYNTNLSINYENQKNLLEVNGTIDYLLNDNLESDNSTTTIPPDSVTLESENEYVYNSSSSGQLRELELIKNSTSDKDLKHKTGDSDELLKSLPSENFGNYEFETSTDNGNFYVNEQNTLASTLNPSKDDKLNNFQSSNTFATEFNRYSQLYTDVIYHDKSGKSTESPIEQFNNTAQKILDESGNTTKSNNTEKNYQDKSSSWNSNRSQSEDFINSHLIVEFHVTNDSSDNSNNNKTNNKHTNVSDKTIQLIKNSSQINTYDGEDPTQPTQTEKTVFEISHEQLHNINLSDIQNRKLKNYIQDQTIDYFNNPNYRFLNLFNLNEMNNKNAEIDNAENNVTPIEKQIQITPRTVVYKNNGFINNLNGYLLRSDELLTINSELNNNNNNPVVDRQNIYYQNNPINEIPFGGLDGLGNANIRNNYNNNDDDDKYNINNNNQYKPALTLFDIYNINKLQSLNITKEPEVEEDNTKQDGYITDPQFRFDKQELYEQQQPTPETFIYPSLGFNLDVEDEVKAFNDAVSTGLIGVK